MIDFSKLHEENHLKVEIDASGIATVTMDRPEKRNAINDAMHRGLEEAFHALSYHPDVGAIVLTGEGQGFCSGGDMKDFGGGGTPMETLRNRDLTWTMARCEAPMISAVNGAARGLGATIALMCDVCYMADTASIGDTHVQFGLTAGDGGQVIWPLLVGPNIAKEYLMRGVPISAQEALRIGLVNRVLPADELMDHAMECAREIASRPRGAVRWTKMAVNKMILNQLNLTLDFGLATELLCGQEPDTRAQMESRKKSL